MKTLIVCATKIESERLISEFGMIQVRENLFSAHKLQIDLLITGIGVPATIFTMFADVQLLKYDFIINAGIAGAFETNTELGTVVNVVSDRFADIGLKTRNGFLPVFESEFNSRFHNLLNKGFVYNTSDYHSFFRDVPKCKGVTVNIPEIQVYKGADIETMEGAAFMLVCKQFQKVFVQIRAISNIVGKTNRKDWDIKTPINNYTDLIIKFVTKYNSNET